MKKSNTITIIGAGIVGTTIAYELAQQGFLNITVIERNNDILGRNQSTTNEGTIHSGLYHPKDIMPLKAKLSVAGNAMLYDFLETHALPYKKVGKLIIATNTFENEYLDFFLNVGIENGVPGIEKISGEKARTMEPNLSDSVIAALYVPSAGVTSPQAVIKKVKDLAVAKGVFFLFGHSVEKISHKGERFHLQIENQGRIKNFSSDMIINAAGLYSDEIAKMINPDFPYEIEPARGEFFHFNKTKRSDIWTNGMHIYQPPYCYSNDQGKVTIEPIPAKDLSTKLAEGKVVITAGVHLSPTYDYENEKASMGDTITISPLKTVGLGKEDYETNLRPSEDYIKKVQYFFEHIKKEDIEFDHTGIMSPLKGHRDFVIEKDSKYPLCINLVGMESPAWTASFAIAKHVTDMVTESV